MFNTITLEETQYILLDDLLDELPESAPATSFAGDQKDNLYPFLHITSFSLSTHPRTIHATFADDSIHTYALEEHLPSRPELKRLLKDEKLWSSATLIENGFRILFTTDTTFLHALKECGYDGNEMSCSEEIRIVDGKKYIKKSRAEEILSNQHELEERMKDALFISSEEIYTAHSLLPPVHR